MKTNVLKSFLFLLLTVIAIHNAYSQQKNQSVTESDNGLSTVTFDTPNGKVTTYLPSKIHAGDVISGTVIAEPTGKNDKQLNKSKNILNGYVVELENEEKPVKNEKATWKIPAILANGISYLILKDINGKEVAKTPVSIISEPREVNTTSSLSAIDFYIPEYLRTGETELIAGAFDGEIQNSNIKINNVETNILAESPEGIFFETPENVSGELDVELTEKDYILSEKVSLIDLNLSSDKLTLAKGDNSSVKIEVTGLGDIEKEVPLVITNLTPSSIKMDGGNEQKIMITPNDIDENGVYKTEANVTATRAGGFSVMVKVDQPTSNYIKTVSPFDGGEIDSNTPEFEWAGYGFPENVNYTLKIYSIDEISPFGQTKEEVDKLEPVYVIENLKKQFYKLPENSQLDFYSNTAFTWIVEAYDDKLTLLGEKIPTVFYTVSADKCRCGHGYGGKVFANVTNGARQVIGKVELNSNPSKVLLPSGPLTLNFTGAELICSNCGAAKCEVTNIVYVPAVLVIEPDNTIRTASVTVTWDCIADNCEMKNCSYVYKFKYRLAPDKCTCGDVKVTVSVTNINAKKSLNQNTSATITSHSPVGTNGQEILRMEGNFRFDNNDEVEIRISGIEAKCWCESGICETSGTTTEDKQSGNPVTIELGENDADASNDNHNLIRIKDDGNGWQAGGDYVIRAKIQNANSLEKNIYQDFIIKYDCEQPDCAAKYCDKNFRILLGHF